jgi:hypothetical protein
MIDLGQWLSEKYVVGGEEAPGTLKTENEISFTIPEIQRGMVVIIKRI